MKTNHFKSLVLICLAVLMTATFSSCNNDRKQLLETVPFDSDAVAAVDLLRLASDCQVKIEDGRLVLPPEMSDLKKEISPEVSKTIARIAGAIDLKNVVIFGSASTSPVATAKVTDIEELRSLIKKYDGDKITDASLEAYKVSGSYIVISNDEKQCWLADREKQIAQIEDYEALDAKKSICRYSGVESALMSDGIAVYAVNLAALQTLNGNYWVTGKFTVDDNAIVAEARVIEPDGSAVETDMLQEIDTDFLRYMPSNFIGAFAFAINPESKDYARLLGEAQKLGGVPDNEVLSYIKALDGTIAFGFGPKNKQAFTTGSPADWQFLAMGHMSQEKVNALTKYVASQLPGSKEGKKGLYTFRSGQVEMTYGNVDGNFAFAFGMPLDSKEENSFAPVFSGKRLASVIQTPLLNTIVNNPKLNYSVKATFELNNDTYVMAVKLVGNDNPIIPTLIKDVPVFFEAFSNAMSAPSLSSLNAAEPDLEEIIEVETGESFNAHMSGTAGPAKIKSFDFFCTDDGIITGTDMYFDTPLPIEGYYNSSTGEVSITESNGDMVTGVITGRLVRNGNNISITGTFVNYKGKSYSLNLSGNAF